MMTNLSKELRDIAQMMTYCCGPFARSPEDVKTLSQELLKVAIYLEQSGQRDAQLIYLLQRLSGGAIVADKYLCIKEHRELICRWKQRLSSANTYLSWQ